MDVCTHVCTYCGPIPGGDTCSTLRFHNGYSMNPPSPSHTATKVSHQDRHTYVCRVQFVCMYIKCMYSMCMHQASTTHLRSPRVFTREVHTQVQRITGSDPRNIIIAKVVCLESIVRKTRGRLLTDWCTGVQLVLLVVLHVVLQRMSIHQY